MSIFMISAGMRMMQLIDNMLQKVRSHWVATEVQKDVIFLSCAVSLSCEAVLV